jgi:RHS repeat-associated protein
VNEITAFGDSAGPQWSSPAYDLAGNMTALPKPASPTDSLGCSYDAWNRLVQVVDSSGSGTVVSYQYDGRGFQTARSSTTAGLTDVEHYYYSDQWQLLQQSGVEGGPAQRQFVWGLRYIDDLVLRDRDTTGDGTLDERLFAAQDANWNVTAIADATGSVAERYGYGAYGACRALNGSFAAASPSCDWEHAYTGQRLDSQTGLMNFRRRHYDASAGRFIGTDPIGYRSGDVNTYRYYVGSPLTNTDPFGLFTLNFGVAYSLSIGPISLSFSAGVALDNQGNMGTYATPGLGLGIGTPATVLGGGNAGGTSAATINDLEGLSGQASGMIGTGVGVGANVVGGWGANGPYIGGSATGGFGLGLGGSAEATYTFLDRWPPANKSSGPSCDDMFLPDAPAPGE